MNNKTPIATDTKPSKKSSPPSPKVVDQRVSLVYKAFYDGYVKHFGKVPTQFHLNMSRDGAKIYDILNAEAIFSWVRD